MDVPNILYVYWKHAYTFKDHQYVESAKIIQEDSDDASSKTSVKEKFVPYEIDRQVRFDFHMLQTSEKIFADEYERVREMVNTSRTPSQRFLSEEFESLETSFEKQNQEWRLI